MVSRVSKWSLLSVSRWSGEGATVVAAHGLFGVKRMPDNGMPRQQCCVCSIHDRVKSRLSYCPPGMQATNTACLYFATCHVGYGQIDQCRTAEINRYTYINSSTPWKCGGLKIYVFPSIRRRKKKKILEKSST